MFFPLRKRLCLIAPVCCAGICQAAVLNVLPGVNNAPIQEVTYSIGGSDVVQSSEASDVVTNGDTSVYVKSVKITDGSPATLTYFNTENAIVVNVNGQQLGIGGIGVFDNGTVTPSTSGLASFATAMAGTSLDTDLRNYGFRDNLTPGQVTGPDADYDLLFYRALKMDDYFMVTERWGNAEFEVTALMADGTPYPNANTLRIGANGGIIPTPVGYQVYDWVTGYAASTNVSNQAQAITMFSVSKFFESTLGQSGPIYGLRINNDGEADIKIVGASANPFTDNPTNPLVAVPEPSGFLLTLLGGTALAFRRRRIS